MPIPIVPLPSYIAESPQLKFLWSVAIYLWTFLVIIKLVEGKVCRCYVIKFKMKNAAIVFGKVQECLYEKKLMKNNSPYPQHHN